MKHQLETIARSRVRTAESQIAHSETCIHAGNPLAAEQQPQRLRERLQAKASLAREEASAMALGIEAFARATPQERTAMLHEGAPEAIYGRTIDFVGIAFLERGAIAARAVARVAYRDGRPQGSGFMVSDRLFLTNHHVIDSARATGNFCLEFDYELDPSDRPRGVTRFALDPEALFLTDPITGLDYTLVGVGAKLGGPGSLSHFGWCGLSDASNKHALGEVANVVQHPDGRYKEVVLRENRLVSRLDQVLHYVADTQPGSSGSPVFNNEWRPIALHHWGGPWRQRPANNGKPASTQINEGIRISALVADLRRKLARVPARQRGLVEEALALGESLPAAQPPAPPVVDDSPRVMIDADGRVTWKIPLEISMRVPPTNGAPPAPSARVVEASTPAPAEEAIQPSTEYADRSGYKPRFIEGFRLDLPRLSEQQKRAAAPNLQAESGDDPFELKYHHFSVVMNKERRLAFFTACNIDGARAKKVDRRTGVVTALRSDDPGLLERLADEGFEGAEASEQWFDDDRIDAAHYAGADVYSAQQVPGFPTSSGMARTLRMFQRGHLVRRMDPAWGTSRIALLADADTFHWTNCSPQVGFFNMGRAAPSTPASAGGKLWRALENYVLRNAVADDMRVSVFTGPVFGANDRRFRTIRVPGRFWKVVVWAEGGALRSLAMIADQTPVIRVWPEAVGDGQESFGDADELGRVEDFVTTVAEIERLTKLSFDSDIVAADIYAGGESLRVTQPGELPLGRRRRPGKTTAAKKTNATKTTSKKTAAAPRKKR
jgi:endonuclease G